jgi:hypothetical protein
LEVLVPTFIAASSADRRTAAFTMTQGVLRRFLPLFYIFLFESYLGASIVVTQYARTVTTCCNH